LIETVYRKQWSDIVTGCHLENWKEAICALMTYCKDKELRDLIDTLGTRLEEDEEYCQQGKQIATMRYYKNIF
jgi:hypothetical protein